MRSPAAFLVLGASLAGCGFKFERPLVPGEIRGRLTVQEAGAGAVVPAKGARVSVVGTTRAQVADERGEFAFREMPFGVYTVRARYDRDGDGKPDNELQIAGARIEKRVVRGEALKGAWDVGTRQLNAAGFLVGTVTRNGEPAKGAAVVVAGLPPARVDPADGGYRVALYDGEWDPAVVYEPGGAPRFQTKVKIQVRGETRLDFALSDADPTEGSVIGRVLRGGEDAHGGIAVRIAGVRGVVEETRTNDDGTFALGGVPAGVYRLEAQAAGFEPASYGAFSVGGEPLPPLTLLPAPPADAPPDCDGDGIPDADDPDEDNDGVSSEPEACACDPAGSTDADQNGVCDELDLPALSSRSLIFEPVPAVYDAIMDADVLYTVTPDPNAVPPLTWQCTTTAGPEPSIAFAPGKIIVTPRAIGRSALRCTATDAEGAPGEAVLLIRATRFTPTAAVLFVPGDASTIQEAVDLAAGDLAPAHDIHVTGTHDVSVPIDLKGENTRLWGGWTNDFSERKVSEAPTRVTLTAPGVAVFRSAFAVGWNGVLDGFHIVAPSNPGFNSTGVQVDTASGPPATISNNIIEVGAAASFAQAFAVRCAAAPCHVVGNVLLGGAGGNFTGGVDIGADAIIAHNLLFCGTGSLCAGIKAEGFVGSPRATVWANIFWLAGDVFEHRHGFVQRGNPTPYQLALFGNAFVDSGTSGEATFYWENAALGVGDHSLADLNGRAALQPTPVNIEGATCVAGLDRASVAQGFSLPAGSDCVDGFTYPGGAHPIGDVFDSVERFLRFDRNGSPRRGLAQGGAVDIGPDERP